MSATWVMIAIPIMRLLRGLCGAGAVGPMNARRLSDIGLTRYNRAAALLILIGSVGENANGHYITEHFASTYRFRKFVQPFAHGYEDNH